MKRILLDQEDFEKLTRGEIVKKDDIQIALLDIGYYNMLDIIETNLNGSKTNLNAKINKLAEDILKDEKKNQNG